MDHTRALGNTADFTLHTADIEAYRNLLKTCVGSHNSLSRVLALIICKSVCKGGNSICDRGNIKGLTDNACGCDNNICLIYLKCICHKLTHSLGNLNSVSIAGVGVTAVTDNSLGIAVCNIIFSYCKGRALNLVSCINGGNRCFLFRINKG